jgi:16S rRNA processing protein RimM
MAPRLILVAQVGGAFGVRGEVKITAYTADAKTLLKYKTLSREDGSPGLTLLSGRPSKTGLVVKTQEITTPEQADALRGLKLFVPRDLLPPPDEDEFYLTDLIGLQARDATGEAVGKVISVQNFGADDLLEIKPPSSASWWLPFTLEAVPEVNIADGWLTVVRPAEIDGDKDH